MRRSRSGSVRTARPGGQSVCSATRRAAAAAPKLAITAVSSRSICTRCGWATTTPASSFETSSSASSMARSCSRLLSTTSTIARASGAIATWRSAPTLSAIACRGWRRSWLAPARKRLLSLLARTAWSRAMASCARSNSSEVASAWFSARMPNDSSKVCRLRRAKRVCTPKNISTSAATPPPSQPPAASHMAAVGTKSSPA
ncbi:hypothetical protein D3C71_874570 [compost metagenome]